MFHCIVKSFPCKAQKGTRTPASAPEGAAGQELAGAAVDLRQGRGTQDTEG